jgi:hypothetical protein
MEVTVDLYLVPALKIGGTVYPPPHDVYSDHLTYTVCEILPHLLYVCISSHHQAFVLHSQNVYGARSPFCIPNFSIIRNASLTVHGQWQPYTPPGLTLNGSTFSPNRVVVTCYFILKIDKDITSEHN